MYMYAELPKRMHSARIYTDTLDNIKALFNTNVDKTVLIFAKTETSKRKHGEIEGDRQATAGRTAFIQAGSSLYDSMVEIKHLC